MVDLHNPHVVGSLTGVDFGEPNELYYAGSIAAKTHIDGLTIRDTNSTGPKLFITDLNDNNMGSIECLANTIFVKVGNTLETAIKATINGATELYYDNAKVSETTANGITGAVWG